MARFLLGLAFLGLGAGCAASSGPPRPEVERTARTVDLSGEWNDTDSDLVAAEIIDGCLKSRWIEEWRDAHAGKKPTLRLYPIKNKTAGYIDYRYFTKQIEQALLRSGKVEVAAAPDESSDPGAGVPADLILNGVLLSQDDHAGEQELRAYLTSVEVIDPATQKKVWEGQKRIRKLISH
jgi:hypothetical protein